MEVYQSTQQHGRKMTAVFTVDVFEKKHCTITSSVHADPCMQYSQQTRSYACLLQVYVYALAVEYHRRN